MDKEVHTMTLSDLKQRFQVFQQGKHFFLFFFFPLFIPGDRIRFKSADGLASSLGSSVLVVQDESVMMMPARMCLTFCAQTLIPTQTIRRFSHLDTGLPVPCLLSAWWLRLRLCSLGFRFYWESQNSPSHMMLDKNWLSWKLLFTCFFPMPAHSSLRPFCLCVCQGGSLLDFKPQLNKSALI